MWAATQSLANAAPSAGMGPSTAEAMEPTHLLRVLDEIDYGMLVIDSRGRVQHANHLARHELGRSRLIALHGKTLMGGTTSLSQQIGQALEAALKGQRRLVLLDHADRELSLAFIPLSHSLESDTPSVLVLMSRQSSCENLSVRMYSRTQNLSPSEESVLIALCRGLTIPDIAGEHGVAESTVRSQIKALREKTGCSSIRRLLQRINSLPPMVPALRIVSTMSHNAMA